MASETIQPKATLEDRVPRTRFQEPASDDTIAGETPIVVPNHLKPWWPTFDQIEVLQWWHRSFARLLDYHYYGLVNTRQERQQRELSSTRRRVKDLITLMTTFDGIGPITIFHFFSRFLDERDLEQISKVYACLKTSNFIKGRALDRFVACENTSSYAGLRYWPEHVNYFLSTYARTTATWDKVLKFKDLKQLSHEIKVEFSAPVNKIAYCWGNRFFWRIISLRLYLDYNLQSEPRLPTKSRN